MKECIMDSRNSSPKDGSKAGSPSNPTLLNLCSINICGMSHRSRFVLDKYCDEKKLDIVAVQETGTCNAEALHLTNMNTITDSNDSRNKGCACTDG